MQITEAMVTPHHLAAAERWIAANGTPITDTDLARMGREVAAEAYRVVEHMACKTFGVLDAPQTSKSFARTTRALLYAGGSDDNDISSRGDAADGLAG